MLQHFSLPLLASTLIIVTVSSILFTRLVPRKRDNNLVPTPTCSPPPRCLTGRCGPSQTSSPCAPQTFIYECHIGWLDCMPSPDQAKPQCQKEYLAWIQSNCPDFQGVAY